MKKDLFIRPGASVKQALRALNTTAMRVLLVVDGSSKLLGTLTDGDIRRGLLRDISLDDNIDGIYNPKPISIREDEYDEARIKGIFVETRVEIIPIVDGDGMVKDIVAWDDFFAEKKSDRYEGPPLLIPVIIMAGGKGTRLAPFTNVLPKPLIPIGDKTIIELIMEEFAKYGINVFFFTLNYRGEMIRAYFEGIDRKFNINYLWEKDYFGTAGSLRLVPNEIEGTIIVSNCDIIVKANYADLIAFHKRTGADLTIVSTMQHHTIPYGVVEFKAGGEVVAIKEKPEFVFPINSGVYVLEKSCIDLIPDDQVFHMTHLIEALLKSGKKVVTYPINESDYIDIGQWDEYRQAVIRIPSIT